MATLVALLLIGATRVVFAGGSVDLHVSPNSPVSGHKLFVDEKIELEATYSDSVAPDQPGQGWRWWEDSEPRGNWDGTSSYTSIKEFSWSAAGDHTVHVQVNNGQNNPEDDYPVTVVDGDIKLEVSSGADIVAANTPAPTVQLTASLNHTPSSNITYKIYAGDSATAFHTSNPTTAKSYSIDLKDHGFGADPAAIRFRVETSDSTAFPIPNGGDGNGTPFDENHKVEANEADVAWVAEVITISSRGAVVPSQSNPIGHLAMERWIPTGAGAQTIALVTGQSVTTADLRQAGYSKGATWELQLHTGWWLDVLLPNPIAGGQPIPGPPLPVMISVIEPNGTGKDHVVVFYGGSADVTTKWNTVSANATTYPYAEQQGFGGTFVNWPHSRYQLPPGQNSNTFIRWLAGQSGLPPMEPVAREHPGASTPGPLSQPPYTTGVPHR